ncbi:hypothetical protein JCM33774_73600 [Actinophytocola sp. KF-1]
MGTGATQAGAGDGRRCGVEANSAPSESLKPDASNSAGNNDALISVTGIDTVELIQRMRSSSINSATIDALSITVDQLCCDYAHSDARKLIVTSKEWLNRGDGTAQQQDDPAAASGHSAQRGNASSASRLPRIRPWQVCSR